jgi:hypothetical protein
MAPWPLSILLGPCLEQFYTLGHFLRPHSRRGLHRFETLTSIGNTYLCSKFQSDSFVIRKNYDWASSLNIEFFHINKKQIDVKIWNNSYQSALIIPTYIPNLNEIRSVLKELWLDELSVNRFCVRVRRRVLRGEFVKVSNRSDLLAISVGFIISFY